MLGRIVPYIFLSVIGGLVSGYPLFTFASWNPGELLNDTFRAGYSGGIYDDTDLAATLFGPSTIPTNSSYMRGLPSAECELTKLDVVPVTPTNFVAQGLLTPVSNTIYVLEAGDYAMPYTIRIHGVGCVAIVGRSADVRLRNGSNKGSFSSLIYIQDSSFIILDTLHLWGEDTVNNGIDLMGTDRDRLGNIMMYDIILEEMQNAGMNIDVDLTEAAVVLDLIRSHQNQYGIMIVGSVYSTGKPKLLLKNSAFFDNNTGTYINAGEGKIGIFGAAITNTHVFDNQHALDISFDAVMSNVVLQNSAIYNNVNVDLDDVTLVNGKREGVGLFGYNNIWFNNDSLMFGGYHSNSYVYNNASVVSNLDQWYGDIYVGNNDNGWVPPLPTQSHIAGVPGIYYWDASLYTQTGWDYLGHNVHTNPVEMNPRDGVFSGQLHDSFSRYRGQDVNWSTVGDVHFYVGCLIPYRNQGFFWDASQNEFVYDTYIAITEGEFPYGRIGEHELFSTDGYCINDFDYGFKDHQPLSTDIPSDLQPLQDDILIKTPVMIATGAGLVPGTTSTGAGFFVSGFVFNPFNTSASMVTAPMFDTPQTMRVNIGGVEGQYQTRTRSAHPPKATGHTHCQLWTDIDEISFDVRGYTGDTVYATIGDTTWTGTIPAGGGPLRIDATTASALLGGLAPHQSYTLLLSGETASGLSTGEPIAYQFFVGDLDEVDFITQAWWNTNPSESEIAEKVFGCYSPYTVTWTESGKNQCKPHEIDVTVVEPPFSLGSPSFDSGTIFVVQPGITPFFMQQDYTLGTCSALVGERRAQRERVGIRLDNLGPVTKGGLTMQPQSVVDGFIFHAEAGVDEMIEYTRDVSVNFSLFRAEDNATKSVHRGFIYRKVMRQQQAFYLENGFFDIDSVDFRFQFTNNQFINTTTPIYNYHNVGEFVVNETTNGDVRYPLQYVWHNNIWLDNAIVEMVDEIGNVSASERVPYTIMNNSVITYTEGIHSSGTLLSLWNNPWIANNSAWYSPGHINFHTDYVDVWLMNNGMGLGGSVNPGVHAYYETLSRWHTTFGSFWMTPASTSTWFAPGFAPGVESLSSSHYSIASPLSHLNVIDRQTNVGLYSGNTDTLFDTIPRLVSDGDICLAYGPEMREQRQPLYAMRDTAYIDGSRGEVLILPSHFPRGSGVVQGLFDTLECEDYYPETLVFLDKINAPLNTTITSERGAVPTMTTVSDISDGTWMFIVPDDTSGTRIPGTGEMQIPVYGSQWFDDKPGSIGLGDTVALRVGSPTYFDEEVCVTYNAGDVVDDRCVRTRPAVVPDILVPADSAIVTTNNPMISGTGFVGLDGTGLPVSDDIFLTLTGVTVDGSTILYTGWVTADPVTNQRERDIFANGIALPNGDYTVRAYGVEPGGTPLVMGDGVRVPGEDVHTFRIETREPWGRVDVFENACQVATFNRSITTDQTGGPLDRVEYRVLSGTDVLASGTFNLGMLGTVMSGTASYPGYNGTQAIDPSLTTPGSYNVEIWTTQGGITRGDMDMETELTVLDDGSCDPPTLDIVLDTDMTQAYCPGEISQLTGTLTPWPDTLTVSIGSTVLNTSIDVNGWTATIPASMVLTPGPHTVTMKMTMNYLSYEHTETAILMIADASECDSSVWTERGRVDDRTQSCELSSFSRALTQHPISGAPTAAEYFVLDGNTVITSGTLDLGTVGTVSSGGVDYPGYAGTQAIETLVATNTTLNYNVVIQAVAGMIVWGDQDDSTELTIAYDASCEDDEDDDYTDDCPDGDFSGNDYDGICEADDDDDDDGDMCPYGDFSGDPDDGTCDDDDGDDGDHGSACPDGSDCDDYDDEIDDLLDLFDSSGQCFYKDIAYREIYFRDVETHPHRDEINLLLNNCIVQGVDPDNYDPYRAITRAEFIKIIEKLTHIGEWHDFPGEYYGTSPVFTDLNNHWALVYGLKSYGRGLLTIDTLLPHEPTTFAQAQDRWSRSLSIEREGEPQWLRDLIVDDNADRNLSRGLAAFYFVDLYGDVLLDLGHITAHKVLRQDIRDRIRYMSFAEQTDYLFDFKDDIEDYSTQEVEDRYGADKDQLLDEVDRVLFG